MAATRSRPPQRPELREVHLRRRAAAVAVVVVLLAAVALLTDFGAGPSAARIGALRAHVIHELAAERARAAAALRVHLLAEGRPSPADQRRMVDHLIALGQPIYCASKRRRFAALTFDDGPSSRSARVFALLRRARVHSTFFHIGRQVRERPGATREAARIGEVGDHTYTHPNLNRLSDGVVAAELLTAKQAIAEATGRAPDLYRPPYGSHDALVDGVAQRLGLLTVAWNVDTQDNEHAGVRTIRRNAIEGLKPGNIIIMHEQHDTTLEALPAVLRAARRKHIKLVTVSALLALNPPSDALVRAGFTGCLRR